MSRLGIVGNHWVQCGPQMCVQPPMGLLRDRDIGVCGTVADGY
jgi:hypothetical protein